MGVALSRLLASSSAMSPRMAETGCALSTEHSGCVSGLRPSAGAQKHHGEATAGAGARSALELRSGVMPERCGRFRAIGGHTAVAYPW